jgi:carbon starvation protein
VLGTDDSRATPAERLNNGRDFEPMDRRVLFGHHFAAIAGAGPLVGPVLAAQMGFLPGTIWIIVGVILAGAVQDMTTLFFSMRRDGKSLGQMAREEIGPVGGAAALIAVLSIMVILLAVLALVVVLALAESPWGSFSLAMTVPIALLRAFTCASCVRERVWRSLSSASRSSYSRSSGEVGSPSHRPTRARGRLPQTSWSSP